MWWVDFEPVDSKSSVGGEIRKERPALILSHDISNKYLNRVQVVPLTSNVERLYPSEAYVTVNGRRSKALADQLTTASKTRLRRKLGRVSEDDLRRVEVAVKVQLGLR